MLIYFYNIVGFFVDFRNYCWVVYRDIGSKKKCDVVMKDFCNLNNVLILFCLFY